MEQYLSDVLDTSLFEKGYLNVICAPCGCGKTTAAINKIAPLASAPRKAIYLIDTQIGKERLAKTEDELAEPFFAYAESIDESCGFFENDNKICVTTYAQFGYWCNKFSNFPENYEYIICDETHNLVNFSEIGTKSIEDIDVHKIARKAICDTVKHRKTMVIGITATPNPLRKLDCNIKVIPIDKSNLHHYTEKRCIYYASLPSIIDNLTIGQRGGIFIKHITKIKETGEILRERGFKPLMLWSMVNKDHPLSDRQLEARQYIIDNEKVPDEYDVFMFNATAETSINIRSHMDFFIAHNTNVTDITQSRGRYRGNLDTLYVYDKRGSVIISAEYLNRDLYMEDLKELRTKLDLKKDDGDYLRIDDMLSLFSDCGYNCDIGKKKRKKCVRITET